MLKGVQGQERHLRGVVDAAEADDATFLVGPVV
jgi:hypothetical protein